MTQADSAQAFNWISLRVDKRIVNHDDTLPFSPISLRMIKRIVISTTELEKIPMTQTKLN